MNDRTDVAPGALPASERPAYRGKRPADSAREADAALARATHVVVVREGERRLTPEGRRALENFASRMRALSRD